MKDALEENLTNVRLHVHFLYMLYPQGSISSGTYYIFRVQVKHLHNQGPFN